MISIAEILRAHTVPGFHNIHDIPQMTFRGWVDKRNYKISIPIASKSFSLDIYNHDVMLQPFAFDINRMATSAFESINGIVPENGLPKSLGWLIIRSYYAAYFAAHAILRIFGISCSQFDSNESRSITEVAKLYSLQGGKTISSGYYSCNYNFSNSTIQCDQLNNTHQDVWKTLHVLLDNLSTKVSTSDFLKKDRDNVIEFLFQLRLGLSNKNNLNNGAWLSKIRNDVNYSHSMGAWYPYVNSSGDHLKMFRILNGWRNPPFLEDLSGDNDHVLFIKTCVSIVSLCKELVEDLYSINGNTFLNYGAMRFINQM